MLVTCQRFGDQFLFGLVWQYSSVQTKYNKGRFKVMAILTYFEPTFIHWFCFEERAKFLQRLSQSAAFLTCTHTTILSILSKTFNFKHCIMKFKCYLHTDFNVKYTMFLIVALNLKNSKHKSSDPKCSLRQGMLNISLGWPCFSAC